jgi:hypothetical protein
MYTCHCRLQTIITLLQLITFKTKYNGTMFVTDNLKSVLKSLRFEKQVFKL